MSIKFQDLKFVYRIHVYSDDVIDPVHACPSSSKLNHYLYVNSGTGSIYPTIHVPGQKM